MPQHYVGGKNRSVFTQATRVWKRPANCNSAKGVTNTGPAKNNNNNNHNNALHKHMQHTWKKNTLERLIQRGANDVMQSSCVVPFMTHNCFFGRVDNTIVGSPVTVTDVTGVADGIGNRPFINAYRRSGSTTLMNDMVLKQGIVSRFMSKPFVMLRTRARKTKACNEAENKNQNKDNSITTIDHTPQFITNVHEAKATDVISIPIETEHDAAMIVDKDKDDEEYVKCKTDDICMQMTQEQLDAGNCVIL